MAGGDVDDKANREDFLPLLSNEELKEGCHCQELYILEKIEFLYSWDAALTAGCWLPGMVWCNLL